MLNNLPNLEHCRVFYFVAKHSSITAAASELFISQPAVSQAMRQLESELGCRLFFRTAKGVKLTPEGEVLYSKVKPAVELLTEGRREIDRMLGMESGEVRVGASDMTLKFYLLPYLEKYHKLFPKIKIIVTNGPTPETLKALFDGKIDFGVITSPFSEADGLDYTEVGEVRDIFVASDRFDFLKGKTVKLSELAQFPIISLEANTSTRKGVDKFLAENGVKLSPEFELAQSDLIVNFAKRNLGIGSVVENFAQEEIKKGGVFELMLDKPLPPRKICVVTAKKSYISVAGKKLFDLLMLEKDKQ